MIKTKNRIELESRLMDGSYGYSTKFLYSTELELKQLNDLVHGYEIIFNKFKSLKHDLKSTLNKRLSTSSTPTEKKDQIQLLTEKFRTPLEKRTFSIFTSTKTQSNQIEMISEQCQEQDDSPNSSKSKKRTAKVAEISIVIESDQKEDEQGIQVIDEQDTKPNKKATKTKKKKKQKESVNVSVEKKSKNPSKKLKKNTDADQEKLEETFRDEKQPEHVDLEPKKTNKVKKQSSQSDLNRSPTETKNKLKLVPKTPMTNRLSRLGLISSTVKKTVKAKPVTRRAAAAARLAATTSNSNQTKQDPKGVEVGKVKKIIDKIESSAQKLVIGQTPQTARKINQLSTIQNTIQKLKTIRSSIDKRKLRLSQAKMNQKRKSEKQVKAFLNDLKQEQEEENDKTKLVRTPSKIVVTDPQNNNKININAMNQKEKELISEILNSVSPKLVISKIPQSLIQHSISASHANKVIAESEKHLSKELNTGQSILNQYRPLNSKAVSSSAIKSTPSKPSYFQSLSNLNSKYMTPSSKLRAEQDEKRKAELLAKELKEKERLAELEKQKQDKLNEAKKKRDEKLKKINDAKQKQKEEAEQKHKDIEKKRLEEQEAKLRAEIEKKKQLNSTTNSSTNSTASSNHNFNKPSNLLASAQKKQILNNLNLNSNQNNKLVNKENCSEYVSSFKKSIQMTQQFQINAKEQSQTILKLQKQQTVTLFKTDENQQQQQQHNHKNLETTYVLNSPCKNKHNMSTYDCTPLQVAKLKDADNYDVSDIRSDDDTDDEDEPSKPIPSWAKEPLLMQKAQDQCLKAVNFTKLFKSSSKSEINLELIFKSKRRKFVERSSSANWTTPPVWSSNGICGEESFLQIRKNC